MQRNEVKTSIDGLEIGMFVSRLERPWIETPFTADGMLIHSHADIEKLRKYAAFVYVDVDEGPAPETRHCVSVTPRELTLEGEEPDPVVPFKKKNKNEYARLRKVSYEIERSFAEELETAKQIKSSLEKNLKKVLYDHDEGRLPDIDLLKEGVEACVGSIIRNPSAFSLLVQLEKSGEYAYNHALSTSVSCARFGRHLGLDRKDIENLALGGMLLDIGQIKLPAELLHKPEKITRSESKIIEQHVDFSIRLLTKTRSVPMKVMRMIATHHERCDGSGYPLGLSDKQIPVFGRVAGIADSYDAMTTNRSNHKQAMSPNEAISELYSLRDKTFQAELVEQFIQAVGLYPTGSLVELNSGEVGVVLELNQQKRLCPTIMKILDSNKQPLKKFQTLDLSAITGGNLKVHRALPYGAFGIQLNKLFS